MGAMLLISSAEFLGLAAIILGSLTVILALLLRHLNRKTTAMTAGPVTRAVRTAATREGAMIAVTVMMATLGILALAGAIILGAMARAEAEIMATAITLPATDADTITVPVTGTIVAGLDVRR